MTANFEEQELAQTDLAARLSLIETMIAEGRRKTERWGWTFVLWGIAYYVAIAWSAFGHSGVAWPVTMIGTSILTWAIASRLGDKQPETTMGRAIGAIWTGVGVSMSLLLFSAGTSGRMDQQMFIAVVAAMLGSANAASSILLKWRAQFGCALIWWAAAVISCFGTVTQSEIAGLCAIFLGQIVFGVYMTVSEGHGRKRKSGKAAEPGRGAAHA